MPSWSLPSRPLWLRPPRERRLARHRALVEGVPPISCGTPELQQQRRAMEKDMDTWSADRWEAYDAPWATLLDQWLAEPEDEAGLRDLVKHHQQAWWPARFAPSRPPQTAVTRLVWDRLQQGQVLPESVLHMAIMSSKPFHAQFWMWALAGGDPAFIKLGAHAFSHFVDHPAILAALPTAAPGAAEALWSRLWGMDKAKALVSWVADPEGRADALLKDLASRSEAPRHDGGGRLLPDVWHEAFLHALSRHLGEPHSFPADRWATFWRRSNREVLRRELNEMVDKWIYDDMPERTWLIRVDAIAKEISPMVPMEWWGDPSFWPSDRLAQMPQAQAFLRATERHAEAMQSIPDQPPVRRPRVRS